MRLFFAFDLPTALRTRAAALLPDPAPDCRRVPADRMHVTLRFVGNVAPETRDGLAEGLRAMPIAPGTASVHGVGTFPPVGRPRVLWAGVECDEPVLEAQARIEALCQANGLESDRRDWSPHLTLARMRGRRPAWLPAFIEEHEHLAWATFEVRRIVLYDSMPGPGGVVYEPIAERVV